MAERKPKSAESQPQGADWFEAEISRGEEQEKTGFTVNADASLSADGPSPHGRRRANVKRVNKGFQVEESRAQAWDILVAKMKSHPENRKTGPELIDEAIDYLLEKYDS